MVKLYKIDCDGNLYFCDYGLASKTEDYRLRGYIVRKAVQSNQRVAIPQRGKIYITHRLPKKAGFFKRFVDDVKHDIKLTKEIGQLLFGIGKSKATRAAEARAYFANKAVPVRA